MVGQLICPECREGLLWALQEGQAGMAKGAGDCRVFVRAVGMHGALPFEWMRSQLRAYGSGLAAGQHG